MRGAQPVREPLERLVPGDHPQVEEDLGSLPSPVLDLLDSYGVRVAVLDHGQTLVDSPALRTVSPSEYRKQRQHANRFLRTALAAGQTDPEVLTRSLRKEGLSFHIGIARRPIAPADIASRRNIAPAHLNDWLAAFEELNRGLPPGILLLPHTYHRGEAIPESRLRNAGEVSAEFVERSLGLNRPEDRLVLLHKKFVASPAQEIDNYRLAIHEMGHALDHLLDRLTGFPGFGALHRQTVDALFAADNAKVDSGKEPEQVFTSDRASENVREYFAEAVEAYFTQPLPTDQFRAGNSRPGLLGKSPELFSYVDKIMTTEFPAEAAPDPPIPKLLPDWVPEPDNEVVFL